MALVTATAPGGQGRLHFPYLSHAMVNHAFSRIVDVAVRYVYSLYTKDCLKVLASLRIHARVELSGAVAVNHLRSGIALSAPTAAVLMCFKADTAGLRTAQHSFDRMHPTTRRLIGLLLLSIDFKPCVKTSAGVSARPPRQLPPGSVKSVGTMRYDGVCVLSISFGSDLAATLPQS
ncbi:hypothetical protein PYCCODRAFT_86940 [Trametes coccinea BRFM310]|uniref:Uncharacterized protein n=1 Tax=Trametes coccinea (strain BRFM310) TaxID=1353009 RepID=A0A1Y2IUX7_TRAC3|nr:hypothetical protein PYCCODRAFT_86940 [Trametes coccinea BRFM310]